MHCPAVSADCQPDPNSVPRLKSWPRLSPTTLHVATHRFTPPTVRPTCGAGLLTDADGACASPDCPGPLCWMQGTVGHAELPVDAVVDAVLLRQLQCCELIRKGCTDPKTSVKEGLKQWHVKCGEGYTSCDCAFQAVEHHLNERGMWVPAGTFSLQWNSQHHDHTCVRVCLCSYSRLGCMRPAACPRGRCTQL